MREIPRGYKRTGVGVIPEDWSVKQLDELAYINPEGLSDSTNPDFAFNYISLEQVNRGRLLDHSEEIFRNAPSRARRILRDGDVLMSTVRPNLMAHLYFRLQVPNAVCSTGFAVLRARKDISDARYLFAHLFGYTFNKQVEKILAGSNYPAINSSDIKLIKIPCPTDLSEQHAIAEALSDMDGLIKSLEALITKKKAIKQSVMQQLLTGKTRLPGFSVAWDTKRIGDLFETTAGGDFDPARYSVVKDESHPFPIYANSLSLHGLYGYSNRAEKWPGSITITARGALGKAFYRDTPFVAIGRLLVLEPKVCMDARFFSSYINHGVSFAIESTGVPQLTAPHVARYFLPVPPKAEQYAISETLSDMDAEIASLERCKDKTLAIKQSMIQQLLTGRTRLIQSDLDQIGS